MVCFLLKEGWRERDWRSASSSIMPPRSKLEIGAQMAHFFRRRTGKSHAALFVVAHVQTMQWKSLIT
jgi:hypothetical protein